ncbi:MAG: hypothetical protein P8X63_03470 [Desulfuromonadaceae bacterium]
MALSTIYFLLVIVLVALVVKLLIPLCEQQEMLNHAYTLKAIQAVHLLKTKIKPGVYTFRWEKGRLLEPVCEKREGNRVALRFVAGGQESEKIQDMPIEFQQQLLLLIKAGLRRGKK